MGLYCLGASRGLWGFCVREWLGGFRACGVFAFLFLLLSLCSLFFYALCQLCFGCPRLVLFLAFALFVCLWSFVAFSLSDEYAKRKGAKCFCVLSSCVVGCVGYSIAASGIRKLLQAVSILRFFPAIHATVK